MRDVRDFDKLCQHYTT